MKNIFTFLISISCVFAYKETLLHYIIDEVEGGSYKYYSLTYNGFIKIILFTEIGDADLYISQIIAKPTYELDEHCLKSATCGEDIILIPDNFQRPINIGVYGHPSHKNSTYILLVYESTDVRNLSTDTKPEIDDFEMQRPSPMSIPWYLLELLFQILF